MAFKDKLTAFMNGRRSGSGSQEGDFQRNLLGEARGYRPGNTTGLKPVAEAQPEEPAAGQPDQSEAQIPAPGFGDMVPANAQPLAQEPVPGEGFTAAMPYHAQSAAPSENSQLQQTGYQPLFRQNAAPQAQQSALQQPLQFQQSAYQQPVQPFQQSAYQQPLQFQQSAYQQPVQPFQQSAYQQPVQFQQSAYQQPVQDFRRSAQQPAQPDRPTWGNGQGERGFNYTANHRRADARPRRSTRSLERERQQQAQQSAQQPVANVSYLNPNHFVDNGTAYAMVMRLAQPLNTARCYRLIEFMRNGETVLVNTELIQDEAEVSRCLDLLYGAAYAMNCVFTRVSLRSLYLITPRSVEVLPYASMEGMAQRDNAARWPGSDPSNPQDPTWQYRGAAPAYTAQQQRPVAGPAYQEMRYY